MLEPPIPRWVPMPAKLAIIVAVFLAVAAIAFVSLNTGGKVVPVVNQPETEGPAEPAPPTIEEGPDELVSRWHAVDEMQEVVVRRYVFESADRWLERAKVEVDRASLHNPPAPDAPPLDTLQRGPAEGQRLWVSWVEVHGIHHTLIQVRDPAVADDVWADAQAQIRAAIFEYFPPASQGGL